ncbi:hypothetical protein ACHAWF_003747 [Thalassiosira exigua]
MIFDSLSTAIFLHSISGIIPFASAVEIANISTLDALVTASSPPAPGKNLDEKSVFQNYFNAFQNGQFFCKVRTQGQYEMPGSDIVEFDGLIWCSNLHFADFKADMPIGYTGNCVKATLQGISEALEAGAQYSSGIERVEGQFHADAGISAVYVPQTNVFEGQLHYNTDNWSRRFWDDGRLNMNGIMWETRDEGDLSPKAATSSFSSIFKIDWVTVDEAATLMRVNATDLTPNEFEKLYANVWIKTHEEEAAMMNLNPDPELDIVEEVKDEQNATSDEEKSIEAEDVANEQNMTDADSSAGGGRKLAKAAGVVSAALRLLGL